MMLKMTTTDLQNNNLNKSYCKRITVFFFLTNCIKVKLKSKQIRTSLEKQSSTWHLCSSNPGSRQLPNSNHSFPLSLQKLYIPKNQSTALGSYIAKRQINVYIQKYGRPREIIASSFRCGYCITYYSHYSIVCTFLRGA